MVMDHIVQDLINLMKPLVGFEPSYKSFRKKDSSRKEETTAHSLDAAILQNNSIRQILYEF